MSNLTRGKFNFQNVKKYLLEDTGKIFAKGMSKEKLFWIFVIFCIFGNYYEQILNLVVHLYQDHTIIWENRRGVIYGPFSPIYGGGAVVILLLLGKGYEKRKDYLTFFYGAILGGAFEYVIGFLQETFVGTKSWDYSDRFMNINGRTSLLAMLCWGAITLIFMKFIYPPLSKMIEKIPYNLGKILTKIVAIVLCIDMLVSWSALLRQTMRRDNIGPFTPVGKFYDSYYTDDVLKKAFPNMKVSE